MNIFNEANPIRATLPDAAAISSRTTVTVIGALGCEGVRSSFQVSFTAFFHTPLFAPVVDPVTYKP